MKKSYKKMNAIFWILISIFAIGKYIYQSIYENNYKSNITTLLFGIVLLILGIDKIINIKKFFK